MRKDRRFTRKQRRSIRDRLNSVIVKSPYRNAYGVERALGLTHSAMAGWLNSRDPVTPDTVSLFALSQELGFSVDWLLFNEGPDQRGAIRPSGEFRTDFRMQLIAELRNRLASSKKELETFLPESDTGLLWEAVVSHFGWLLLGQAQEEYEREKGDDFFRWLLSRPSRNRDVRPFRETERIRPL